MDYAKHIGRVGALAVVLGVGFAVANSPVIALADETGTQSHDAAEGTASGPSASDDAGATASGTTADSEGTAEATPPGTTEPTTTTTTGTTTVLGDPTTPQVTISSSGGAQSSTESDEDTLAPEPEPALAEVPDTTDIDAVESDGGPPNPTSTSEPAGAGGPGAQVVTPTATGTSDPIVVSASVRLPRVARIADTTAVPTTAPAANFLAAPSDVDPQVVSIDSAPPAATHIISRLLTWAAGLGPLLSGGPANPVEAAASWLMLAAARNEFGRTAELQSVALTSAVPAAAALPSGAVAVGQNPAGVAATDDHIYVANSSSKTVSAIDTATGVATTINVGSTPTAVAVNPDGSRAYVTLKGNSRVAVIDTATNTVIANVKVGFGPNAVAVSADGSRVFVTNGSSSTVSVIDAATNTEIDRVKVGSTPTSIAVDSAGKVYVTTRYNDTLAVINTATNTVSKIKVGDSPRGVAVTPDGTKAFVTNYDGTVSVVNTATGLLTAKITVGKQPIGVAVSPDGNLTWVANSNDTVSVIDAHTNTVLATLSVDPDPETGIHYIAVSPDGTQLYVTDARDRSLRVIPTSAAGINHAPTVTVTQVGSIDPATGAVTYRVTVADPDVGDTPSFAITDLPDKGTLQLNADGSYTFTPTAAARAAAAAVNAPATAKQDAFTVTATDDELTATRVVTVPVVPPGNTVVGTVALPHFASGVAVTPDGKWIYTSDGGAGHTVTVTDALTNTVVGSIDLGPDADGVGPVTISKDGKYVYVGNFNEGTVSVIQTSDNTVITTIDVDGNATDLALSPDGTRLLATGYNEDVVAIIDTATNTQIGVLYNEIFNFPTAVTYSPDGAYAYVTTSGATAFDDPGFIAVFDMTTQQMVDTITVGSSPQTILASPDGKRLYAANIDGSLAVIDRTTNKLLATLPTIATTDLTISPDSRYVYASSGLDTVQIIDTSTNTITGSINVGDNPQAIAISADGTHLYTGGVNLTIISITPASALVV